MNKLFLAAATSLIGTGLYASPQDYEYSELEGFTQNMGEFYCRYDLHAVFNQNIVADEYVEYMSPDLDSCMQGARIWAQNVHLYYPYYFMDLEIDITARVHPDDDYAIKHRINVPRPQ